MREIKFRLRLKSKIDFGTMKEGEILTMVAPVFDIKNGLAYFPIDTKVWELLSSDEFTGLKDKHNNDIFEGDIVKRPSSNGTAEQMAYGSIKENKGCYYIDFGGGYWTHGLLLYHFANCEVIGNIHQHPELLK